MAFKVDGIVNSRGKLLEFFKENKKHCLDRGVTESKIKNADRDELDLIINNKLKG